MTSTQKNENVQMNKFPEGTLSLPHIGRYRRFHFLGRSLRDRSRYRSWTWYDRKYSGTDRILTAV